MLYVTTRGGGEAGTSYWAMTHEAEKGQLLPKQFPDFAPEELEAVKTRTFNQNVAHVMNLFYREQISAWDVDMAFGKHPLELTDLNSRITAARLWWGSDRGFQQFVGRLFRAYSSDPFEKPSSWFLLSVRMAVLVGIMGKLMAQGIVGGEETIDLSVPSFDFQFPMAAWYVRNWGFPIGRIICCCNENNTPWILMNQEDLRMDRAVRHTLTVACDQAIPGGLERLLYHVLGSHEADRFGDALEKGTRYQLTEEQRRLLRSQIAVSVISQRRLRFLLPNLFRDGQWMDPYAAMSYAGLVDHRANTGDTGRGLVICQEDPVLHAALLEKELGITEEMLRHRLGRL